MNAAAFNTMILYNVSDCYIFYKYIPNLSMYPCGRFEEFQSMVVETMSTFMFWSCAMWNWTDLHQS
ncbi:hypothetical protein M6B38_141725 [Iris pallida]|uniref:Uncharacterized protein n=1 Tax=Iris pallida TaxID=29817 RepID=A0AAX6FBX4_IRIPA|nr:hypothetical protein M6B38_141725 [Iris pallida]